MKKKISIYITLFLSVILASYFWSVIELPLNQKLNYGDEYFTKSYSKYNDTFKFFIFILTGLLPFIFIYNYLYKKEIYSIKDFLRLELNNNSTNNNSLSFIFLLMLIFCLIEFFLIDFTWYISNIDMFHEGLWITSAFNYLKTGQLWSSSYIDRGLFGNFYPVILWNFNENIGIGSVRLADLFLLLVNKILLLFLAKQITESLNFNDFKKIIFFIISSFLFISLVDYQDLEEFVPRSLLSILFLNIFLHSLKNKKIINFFVLGLFSVISILWYLDIGAYVNFTILLILIFFLIRGDVKVFLATFVGLITGWLTFFLLFPPNELQDFFFNTKNIYYTIDQIHGLIFPTPFFAGDTRATKTLVFFIMGGVFTTYICLDRGNFKNSNKIFFFFLFVLSLVSFKTGLSRSDDPHIKVATGPLLLIIYTYLSYWLMHLTIFKKAETIIINNIKLFKFIFIILLFLNFKIYQINGVFNFKDKLDTLLQANDVEFLKGEQEKYIDLIKYYKNVSLNNNCIQILTDENALPYFLKKKTCTKYYQIWILQPEYMQNKFIEALKDKKPKIILIKTKSTRYTPKLKLVERFINNEYTAYDTFNEWTFLKINQ
ncbi:hypothetical protein N9S62_01350 [Pelagibacteraceae bacterium]|nr:hypothetical protein [Pelagibacteraceae bacterium]